MIFPLRPPFIGFPFNNYYNYKNPSFYSKKNLSKIPYQKQLNPFIQKNISSDNNNLYSPYIRSNSDSNNFKKIDCLDSLNGSCVSNDTFNINKKKPLTELDGNYFFEVFGIKLYFDDILLICLLFFLYEEGVKDQELFVSLILLLLS